MKTLITLTLALLTLTLVAEDAKKCELTAGPFQLKVSKGFTLADKQAQGPMTVYGYSMEKRKDGTACSLVITVMDFSKYPRKPEDKLPTVAQFLQSMVGGVARSRTEFNATEPADVKLEGLTLKKTEWSGKASGLAMKGVIYSANKGEVYISIQAQDIAAYSDKTLPLCEKVVKTLK